MGGLLALAHGLGAVNGAVLALGRWLGAICMGAMTVIILMQVFYRYVLGNALAWPEEASRFLMLWVVGLMAATAWRRGGFVAIDMLIAVLPRRLATFIAMVFLVLIGLTLVMAVEIGWRQVTGIGGRSATDSLWLPTPDGWWKLPKWTMMSSMVVCVAMLLMVTVEHFLRSLVVLLGGAASLQEIPETVVLGSE
jgi:TRAP-type C4-dicarboxylate transport system permease small subunit